MYHRRAVRGRGALLAAPVIATLIAAAPAGCLPAPASDSPGDDGSGGGGGDGSGDAAMLRFGTLASSLDHTDEEAAGGVTAAMVEISWEVAEPEPGVFDQGYLDAVRADVNRLRASGRTVTLGLALHYTPAWVFDIPDSRMEDEDGDVSEEADMIFNQKVRDEADAYMAALDAELDLSTVDAIRLTSGGGAEVLYPGDGTYWAFGPNAQNGPDMPPTMAPNPAPGWLPGDGDLSDQELQAWVDWYIGALDDAVEWQIATLSSLGFRGTYEVLTPGIGIQPAEVDEVVREGLPPGLLGVGAAWEIFYRQLARRPDIVAYVSSVADNSGPGDVCDPADGEVALDDPMTTGWSSTRWVARVAGEYGYPVSGENPGWQNPPDPDLEQAYQDLSDGGMMASAIRKAHACHFTSFYWAHDQQLWDGTVPFSAYAEQIAGGP